MNFTLLNAAIKKAERAHAERLHELEDLQPLLAQLEQFLPLLESQGLHVSPDMLAARQERLRRDVNAPVHTVLRLRTRGLLGGQFGGEEKALDWWRTFTRSLDFSCINVDAQGSVWPTALLRRGKLLMRVDLPRDVHVLCGDLPVTPGQEASLVPPAPRAHRRVPAPEAIPSDWSTFVAAGGCAA